MPDDAGLSYWVNALVSKRLSEVDVLRSFLVSSEYQALHPGSKAYLQGLYMDLLGRPAADVELAAWQPALQLRGPDLVVRGFLASEEAGIHFVNSYYTNLLRRSPVPGEQSFWVRALQEG